MDTSQQLLVAAENGQLEEVRRLIQAGVPLDVKDNDGCTPLHLATWEGYLDVVKVLLNSGADYTIYSKINDTAKNLARIKGHKFIIKSLQEWEDTLDIKEPVCD